MFPSLILSDNSEARHSSISIYPFSGTIIHVEFLCRSSKDIWFGAFQIAPVFRSSAVRISFSRRDLRFSWSEGESVIFEIMDHDSDLLDAALWYHDGFFQTTAGVRSDRGRFHLWTFWVLLIASADSVYFCAIVLFWLEIRLITFWNLCFW